MKRAVVLSALLALVVSFAAAQQSVSAYTTLEEPLAKVGASDDVQLYGEIGLKYGSERAHGVLRGLAI